MKVKYVKKPKPNDFHNPYFTYEKEYEVKADYRQRHADNGLVIMDDMNQVQMVYEGDFKISDVNIENTFVFRYNAS